MDNGLIHKLSKEQEDSILTSIGYTRQQLKADLKQIREWLEQQHHLPECRKKESDAFLQMYLTGCKGSLETVKKKLDNYYTVRNYSEIFDNRDPLSPIYVTTRNMIEGMLLPNEGYNGERLGILRYLGFEPENLDYVDYVRILINVSEMYTRIASVNSRFYMLFDCSKFKSSYMLKIRPSITRDLLFMWKEVMPFRFIRVKFINAPNYVEAFVNTFIKPFLSKKLQDRVHLSSSGGYEDIFNYFSPSILPREYGGDSSNPSISDYNALWFKYEQDKRDWFLNELSERTDESKRIVTDKIPKNPYFGVHGSLKKLVID